MNPNKITCSGGVLGGSAETSEIYQNKPLAAKSLKMQLILMKSRVLEGFWAGRPNLENVPKQTFGFKITDVTRYGQIWAHTHKRGARAQRASERSELSARSVKRTQQAATSN